MRMGLNRFAKRRDANEPELIEALRKCGLMVKQQDQPDLLIRRSSWPAGIALLIEIDGIEKYRQRSSKQLEFLGTWGIPRAAALPQVMALVAAFESRLRIPA
jgi:hypothetical protein